MQNPIWQNNHIKIEIEESKIPWIKVFTNESYKEMSEVPKEIRLEIFELLDIIEKEMLDYYNPTKINIASFGNYMPQVHWHIMARFADDSYFPEPMWGKQQRESKLNLPSFDIFLRRVLGKINKEM